jgi:hypothetical protein
MQTAQALLLLSLVFTDPATADKPRAPADDPPEVALGERLFLETRFAQFFAVHSKGDANAVLREGDPSLERTVRAVGAPLRGPFAGQTMSCRACHLVDELASVAGGGNRTYADFARRSPLPVREDGRTVTVRNAPSLVGVTRSRNALLLHVDGEFASAEDLARETLLGRDYGWLVSERAQAVAQIAHIVRRDDGRGALAEQFGGAYRVALAGSDPSLPDGLRLSRPFRIDVERATDAQVVDAVARLLAAYLESLTFAQDGANEPEGSPYDAFLRKNGLARVPAPGESDVAYARRLRQALDSLKRPRWVAASEGRFKLHRQPFVFGPLELAGLRVFLRERPDPPRDGPEVRRGGTGNCMACHPPPSFTDFAFHNTGVAQSEYDAVHGPGAFVALAVPDLASRNADVQRWLPPAAAHPSAPAPFFRVPAVDRPGHTDLGLWNVFGNPAVPTPQERIRALLCREGGACSPATLLERSLARFKTPALRDLGHSAPYLHTGAADTLEQVLHLYATSAALARAGGLRNAAPELGAVVLSPGDVRALAAFLRALNEDYE